MQKQNDPVKNPLDMPHDEQGEHSHKAASHIAVRKHLAKKSRQHEKITRGQRAADAVARFGGSWTFIGIFAAVMIIWVVLNSVILIKYEKTFDPYPYILLNLFLSMLASIQAPIILMSQNRHAEKDRLDAEHDYEVNLEAQLEIMSLHEKMDALREGQWNELLAIQQRQLDLLTGLIDKTTITAP